MMSMDRILLIDISKCRACRTCELACSFFKGGECNPARSRIHSERWEDESFLGTTLVRVCQQCSPPVCKVVCPTAAITLDKNTGATLIDYTLCNGCGLCIRVCPFGSIRLDHKKKIPLVCDLCGGKPKCAEWCPAGAISHIPATRANVIKKRESSAVLLSLVRQAAKHLKEG